MTEQKEIKPENWDDLPDDSDLRKLYAECKKDGKDVYQEMKSRGHVFDMEKFLQENSE